MRSVLVILAAGGSGRRMGGEIPKQLLKLGGRTLLQRSLEKFASHPAVAEIVIPSPLDWIPDIQRITESFRAEHPLISVTEGGESRQESVLNALRSSRVHTAFVCIHDAVRPMFSPDILDRALEKLSDCGGVIPGVPALHTMKEVRDGYIHRTVDRGTLYQIHTPQVFRRDIYEKAWAKAVSDCLQVTDDASLLEYAGEKIALIPDSYDNIKVTVPGDLELLERILERKGVENA